MFQVVYRFRNKKTCIAYVDSHYLYSTTASTFIWFYNAQEKTTHINKQEKNGHTSRVEKEGIKKFKTGTFEVTTARVMFGFQHLGL